jgi:hypothetical protein
MPFKGTISEINKALTEDDGKNQITEIELIWDSNAANLSRNAWASFDRLIQNQRIRKIVFSFHPNLDEKSLDFFRSFFVPFPENFRCLSALQELDLSAVNPDIIEEFLLNINSGIKGNSKLKTLKIPPQLLLKPHFEMDYPVIFELTRSQVAPVAKPPAVASVTPPHIASSPAPRPEQEEKAERVEFFMAPGPNKGEIMLTPAQGESFDLSRLPAILDQAANPEFFLNSWEQHFNGNLTTDQLKFLEHYKPSPTEHPKLFEFMQTHLAPTNLPPKSTQMLPANSEEWSDEELSSEESSDEEEQVVEEDREAPRKSVVLQKDRAHMMSSAKPAANSTPALFES